ncbi:hypothetical protein TMatcc_003009 [Talaromyces marneffei ATCC 18224]
MDGSLSKPYNPHAPRWLNFAFAALQESHALLAEDQSFIPSDLIYIDRYIYLGLTLGLSSASDILHSLSSRISRLGQRTVSNLKSKAIIGLALWSCYLTLRVTALPLAEPLFEQARRLFVRRNP